MSKPIFDELYTREGTGGIFEIVGVGESGYDAGGAFAGGILVKKELGQVVNMKELTASKIGFYKQGIVKDNGDQQSLCMTNQDQLSQVPADGFGLSRPIVNWGAM